MGFAVVQGSKRIKKVRQDGIYETALVAGTENCAALRQSPVDIDTRKVVDPGIISAELREPVRFYLAQAGDVRLHVRRKPGGKLRFVTTSKDQSPFGEVLLGGERHPIDYIDLLIPSEHAIDGRGGATELQLVSSSRDGLGVSTSISLRLNVGPHANGWLAPILSSDIKIGEQENLVRATAPFSELHVALQRGFADNYFRYDGTLTTPPCSPSQWFLLEDPGQITQEQLLRLGQLAGVASEGSQPSSRFRTALVAWGTPRLVTGTTQVATGASAGSGVRGKVRLRRIVA